MTIPISYYTVIRRTPNLICYWRLNDINESSVALDWGDKYNYNGLYKKLSNRSPALIDGDSNSFSRKFESEQYLEIPHNERFDWNTEIAFEMWISSYKPTQTSVLLAKMDKEFTFPSAYYLGLESGKVIFSAGNGTSETSVISPQTIPVATQTHIAVTFFRKVMSILINGNIVATKEIGSQEIVDPNRKPIFIGGSEKNIKIFNGLISEVAYYKGVVSASTFLSHYNIGRQVLPEPARITTFTYPSFS